MSVEHELPPEERLFQAALAFGEDEREAFIKGAAGEDEELYRAVQLLLQGYAEEGGDEGDLTLSVGKSARQQWAGVVAEEPGMVIGHFRLVRQIGQGGMGTVWEAEQTAPVKRRVALKVIKLGMDTVEVVKRFERERQALALMNHPNIAQVHEAGATSLGRPYFAMELVEGSAITEYAESVTLPIRDRLALLLDVCGGIEHAHQKGIIHRDLKPSNILVSSEQAVKVIDFGVAKATQETGGGQTLFMTKMDQVLGTPAYMSPEQAASDGVDVDTRADVYSLGIILYELLTGKLPIDPGLHAKAGEGEMWRIIREDAPPKPSTLITTETHGVREREVRSQLHGDLDWVVMKALEKDPDRRYVSVAALREDIQRYLDGDAVDAVPPTVVYRLGKFVKKYKLVVVSTALVVLALVAGLMVSLIQTKRAQDARQEVTFTVADLYTRNGLTEEDPTTSALWFAKAAMTASADARRVEANGSRQAAWRQEASTVVRAFDTGFPYANRLVWHPTERALIVEGEEPGAQVWNLENEAVWNFGGEYLALCAAWSPNGDQIAMSNGESISVFAYPSGEELARLEGEVLALRWSPDGEVIAVSAAPPFLWEWASGQRHALPEACDALPEVMEFSDCGRLLVEWQDRIGVCDRNDPSRFLFEPLPVRLFYPPRWLDSGDRFLMTGETGVEIREASSGALIESYPEFMTGGTGNEMAVSPDARFIVHSQPPGLDRQTGERAVFPNHRTGARAKTFSRDGSLLATGGYDELLKLWSVPEGRLLETIGHAKSAIIAAAFSPNANLLAASENGTVKVYRLGKAPFSYRLPLEGTSLAKLSADGSLVLPTGASYNGFKPLVPFAVYETATGQEAGPRVSLPGRLMDAAFVRGDTSVALAVSTTPNRPEASFQRPSGDGGSGYVQMIDHRTGAFVGEPIIMPSEPRGICLHPTEEILGVCCAAGEGLEIDLKTREVRPLFDNEEISHPHEWSNNGRCAFSPDGEIFYVWGLYQYLHAWDRSAGKHLFEPFHNRQHVPDLTFADEGVVSYVSIAQENFLSFVDSRTGDDVVSPILYPSNPWLGRFDSSGKRFLAGGTGKVAEVWDWRARARFGPTLLHEHTVSAGSFLAKLGQARCVTGCLDGSVRFWDYETGMALRPSLSHPESWILEMQGTPDGSHLVVCHTHGIDVIDVEAALPAPLLDRKAALQLAVIDAGAEVHPSGGLAPLTHQEWLKRWHAFRAAYPDFPGHQLSRDSEK